MAEVEQAIVPLSSSMACERSPPSSPWLMDANRWDKAEKIAEEIISKFQPTIEAERRRIAVITYLQRLIKGNLDCEVFAYGSVPLKTYLPDGDIDLSAVGAKASDLVKDIASLLETEGKKSFAEFVVKDVQLIGAEVKLVKCIVENLVVDISVNQIGGLCTLCFLEQVDRVIGRDHLFKRSIILIKAWCYFESRTLGAHVGLISTYGLETLVLYIFHVFHIAIEGPISVLFKFLEYFSNFDWDNYAVSLVGPVRLSKLPRIVAERPPNRDDLLLKSAFLRYCSETLSVPARAGDVFPRKHLNIVDPLNDHNNLGRSVSQGNFFRIRSAFGYGARKLGQILARSGDNLAEELELFFANTLTMHGSGQRPDLDIRVPGAERSFTTSVNGNPLTSEDESSPVGNGFPENQPSSERKDNSTLDRDRVVIPICLPHLLCRQPKLTNGGPPRTEKNEEVVPCAVEGVPGPPESLDLAGDLMTHFECLEHVRWWSSCVSGPPTTMGRLPPPPPPPPILLSMIASENGGMNGFVHRPGFHPSSPMFMSRPPFAANEPSPRGTMTYFRDTRDTYRPRHGYQSSTPNTDKNNGPPNPNSFIPPLVNHNHSHSHSHILSQNHPPPVREPLNRRRHQNPNRAPRPADETQRPRHVSGTDRTSTQSSYHLKDEDDFPPLSV